MKIYIDKPHSLIHQGQRTNQEDCIYPELGRATSEDKFFILCDGMGGHASGEVASSTVCEKMSQWIRENITDDRTVTKELVISALDAAYDGLDEKDDPTDIRKMGTTMTFVMFHRSGCTVAHIGDSRVYHISPLAQSVRHTQDHSLVNDLLKCGEITEDEVATSKVKNVITRAMQPHQERRSKPDVEIIEDIYPGDYFYMCSDGMLEHMTDEQIYKLIADTEISDEEKIDRLLSETKDNKDNHSAHLIRINRVCNDDGTDIVPPKAEDIMEAVEIEEKDALQYDASPMSTPSEGPDIKEKTESLKNSGKDSVTVNDSGDDSDEDQTILPDLLQKKSAENPWLKIKVMICGILLFVTAYLIGKIFFFVRDHHVEILSYVKQIFGGN